MWGGAGRPRRPQFGQQARGHFQMRPHIAAKRVEHLAVLQRGSHLALAQQGRQVVQVPGQRRELGAGCVECCEQIRAGGRAAHRQRHLGQQAGDIGTARQPGSRRARRKLCDLGTAQSD